MSERQYKDVAGNPCSLRWLVNNEPEWAISQILHRDKLESERDALQARVKRLEEAGDALESDKKALKKILADMGVVGSMGIGSTVKWAKAKEAKP